MHLCVDVIPVCGCHTCVWMSYLCVDVIPVCGCHTYVWMSYLCVDVIPVCGYLCVDVIPVCGYLCVDVIPVCGCHTCVWMSHLCVDVIPVCGCHTCVCMDMCVIYMCICSCVYVCTCVCNSYFCPHPNGSVLQLCWCTELPSESHPLDSLWFLHCILQWPPCISSDGNDDCLLPYSKWLDPLEYYKLPKNKTIKVWYTYWGNTIENRGCLFIYLDICMDVCMYVILYFDPSRFCVSYVVYPVPNCTKQNPLVYRSVLVSP